MAESVRSRLARWRFNLFPAFRRTGGRITYIADDWREVRVELPLNRATRNYVGTIFGGSLYGAADGHIMVMLIKLLGPNYVVWDKAATIRFKKPGRTTLYTRFTLDEQEITAIRELLDHEPKVDRVYQVDWMDHEGTVHASLEKIIHIRRKSEPQRITEAR